MFLATSDPDTARYGSELCGKTEKTRINYSLSENSNDAHVGLLSGKASANRATVSTSKTYQKQKEALFEDKVFYQLQGQGCAAGQWILFFRQRLTALRHPPALPRNCKEGTPCVGAVGGAVWASEMVHQTGLRPKLQGSSAVFLRPVFPVRPPIQYVLKCRINVIADMRLTAYDLPKTMDKT